MKDINEKQVEEMTSEVRNFKERTRFLFGWDGRPKDEIFATLFLEAGYRKQSDTVREFVEKIGEVALQMRYEASRVYQARNSRKQFAFGEKNAIINLMAQINELVKEYGAEVGE